jgi:flagellar basal body-associated protein FliL
MNNSKMKGSVGIILLVVCLVMVIGMLSYIFFVKPHSLTVASPAATASSLQITPTIPVKNFASGTPDNLKTVILIQTDDSSDEKYIVPTSQIDFYVKSLPEGDHVISKTAM